MAYFIELNTITDERGLLTVVDRVLPFEIKRVYYIYNVKAPRGSHKHKKTVQALICISGSCKIFVDDGASKNTYILDKPNKCLILEPEDWHTIDKFSNGAILLVLSSEHYDPNDYVHTRCTND